MGWVGWVRVRVVGGRYSDDDDDDDDGKDDFRLGAAAVDGVDAPETYMLG